ncbi:MAG: TIGR03826 family flagellar region protein [Bacillota bacterium]
MGDIRNCPRCGRVFSYVGRPICNNCLNAEEDEFKRVKDYIYDNPGANMSEVSEATDVSVEKIMRFLRDERLEIVSGEGNMILECERCSKAIKTGRFCETCKDELATGLKKEFGLNQPAARPTSEKRPDKDQMYTATRRK